MIHPHVNLSTVAGTFRSGLGFQAQYNRMRVIIKSICSFYFCLQVVRTLWSSLHVIQVCLELSKTAGRLLRISALFGHMKTFFAA